MSNYLATERVMVAAAALVLVMMGWFFTLVVNSQRLYNLQMQEVLQRLSAVEVQARRGCD